MIQKKELLKILKSLLKSGNTLDVTLTENISTWMKEDGYTEKDLPVRTAKLLRSQNREYLGIISLVLEFLEYKKKKKQL